MAFRDLDQEDIQSTLTLLVSADGALYRIVSQAAGSAALQCHEPGALPVHRSLLAETTMLMRMVLN